MAWLGLSLPLWLIGIVSMSPVVVRCTSVSVPAEYDRGFAQVAVVCWVTFRAPDLTPSGGLPGSTDKSLPQSSGLPTEASGHTPGTPLVSVGISGGIRR
jgi:hypothetical protein